MCKVDVLSKAEKRTTVRLKNGKTIYSEWYLDDGVMSEEFIGRTNKENEVYNQILAENNINDEDVEEWFIGRKRENGIVYISDHAVQRMKERNGWNLKTALRMVKKIYDDGLRANEVDGYLRTWLEKKNETSVNNDEYVMYGNFLYIFNSNTLITVIHVPKKTAIRAR